MTDPTTDIDSLHKILLEWSDPLGLYRLPTHTVDNFKTDLTLLLLEAAESEIKDLPSKVQHHEMLDKHSTGLNRMELNSWHYENYLKDRLKELTAQRAKLMKGENDD